MHNFCKVYMAVMLAYCIIMLRHEGCVGANVKKNWTVEECSRKE